MTSSSEQLQRNAERARERLAESLDDLRHHLSPSIVIDNLLGTNGRLWKGDELLPALVQQAKNNPVAYGLIAAGLGWLIYSGTRAPLSPVAAGRRRAAAKRHKGTRKTERHAKPARRNPSR